MYASTSSSSKDNLLRSVRFERPDYIPMTFHINEACWRAYEPEALFDLMEAHPFLFPGFHRPQGTFAPEFAPVARRSEPYVDGFGCRWETAMDGIVGSVHEHPLSDWGLYDQYVFPDPEASTGLYPIDWKEFEQDCADRSARGEMTYGDLRHGHTFQQLVDLRGYENVLYDMMDDEPRLWDLIARLEAFNLAQIEHFVRAGVDMIRIPEDLGMQTGPMLSPADFERFIKPSYQRLMAPARQAGIAIHMHSDGNIRSLCGALIEGGVDVLNLQDLVNGVDWIAEKFRGRICIDLDIDRQSVTPFGTPSQVDALIREEAEKISCPQGGLMMIYGLYPGVPLENVRAVMDAMERYAFLND